MKIALPASLQIGGVTYSVKWDDVAKADLKSADCYGRCDKGGLWIHVDVAYPRWPQTFWHEVVHTVNHEYCQSKMSEEHVDGIASGLSQVLKQLGIELALEEKRHKR